MKKIKELFDRCIEVGLTGNEDCHQVVEAGPVGSGDEWDVKDPLTGDHIGCLYDGGGGYKFSFGAFAGDD